MSPNSSSKYHIASLVLDKYDLHSENIKITMTPTASKVQDDDDVFCYFNT